MDGSPYKRAARVGSYRDLVAWQKANALAHCAYDVADRLPDYEKYALASQIRRAGTSVYSNIAEGYGTGSRRGFLKHLRIARGSLAELDSHLGFVRDRKSAFVEENIQPLIEETGRVLHG